MHESARDAPVDQDAGRARLRAGYDAFARGDIEALLATLDPDVEFHNPPYAIETGVRYGRGQFGRAMHGVLDSFEYDEITVKEIGSIGHRFVVEMHVRGAGKISGAPVDATFFHVWTLRDGWGVRLEWYLTLEEAFEAARRPD